MNNDRSHSENHLTAKQMQDYFSDNLSDIEMHRIEKHLLECDFCAEAMEGLESMVGKVPFDHDVSKLKKQIEIRTQVAKKEPVFIYKRVLRIAAMVAVLVVASVLITNYFKSNLEQKEFSEKKKTELLKKKKSGEKGEEKQVELNSDSTIKPIEEKSSQGGQESTKPESVKEEAKVEEKIDLVDDDKQARPIEVIAEDDMLVMDEEVVLDEEIVSTEDEVAVEDEINVESMEVQEEMVMGMTSKDEAIPSSAKERSMYTAAGVEATSVQKKSESKKEIVKPQPANEDTYQQYLKDSLNYPEEAFEAKIKGSVTLQFTVGVDGDINQIKVIKGLGYGCDEEAIRLITEGPKWVPGSEDGVPVEMEADVNVKFKPL